MQPLAFLLILAAFVAVTGGILNAVLQSLQNQNTQGVRTSLDLEKDQAGEKSNTVSFMDQFRAIYTNDKVGTDKTQAPQQARRNAKKQKRHNAEAQSSLVSESDQTNDQPLSEAIVTTNAGYTAKFTEKQTMSDRNPVDDSKLKGAKLDKPSQVSLKPTDLKQAMIYKEILSKPKSLR